MSRTCESVQQNLLLYLYGEGKAGEQLQIRAHLETCPACRAALEKCTSIHRALDAAPPVLPGGLLVEARRRLQERLAAVRERPVEPLWWGRIRSSFADFPVWLKPASAVGLAVLVFFAGRASVDFWAPPAAQPVPQTARVRFIELDPDGREVRIAVDETQQRVLRGTLEDPKLRQLLVSAAKDSQDPGLRAEIVELLGRRPDEGEIRDALIHALEHDVNAAVRLKALEGLKPYARDSATRQALTRVLLQDPHPNVRALAIDLLTHEGARDVVAPLQELMRKEDNDYVRMRTEMILSQLRASPGVF